MVLQPLLVGMTVGVTPSFVLSLLHARPVFHPKAFDPLGPWPSQPVPRGSGPAPDTATAGPTNPSLSADALSGRGADGRHLVFLHVPFLGGRSMKRKERLGEKRSTVRR